jgi:hypothetical protein
MTKLAYIFSFNETWTRTVGSSIIGISKEVQFPVFTFEIRQIEEKCDFTVYKIIAKFVIIPN